MLLPCQSGPMLSVIGFAPGFPSLPPSTASGWSCSRNFINLEATRTIHKAKICWAPILPACQGRGLQSDMAPFHITVRLCHPFSTWLWVCTAFCLSINLIAPNLQSGVGTSMRVKHLDVDKVLRKGPGIIQTWVSRLQTKPL